MRRSTPQVCPSEYFSPFEPIISTLRQELGYSETHLCNHPFHDTSNHLLSSEAVYSRIGFFIDSGSERDIPDKTIMATTSPRARSNTFKATQRGTLNNSRLSINSLPSELMPRIHNRDPTHGLSGTVIIILPCDSNASRKAFRRYSESPKPPTKIIR